MFIHKKHSENINKAPGSVVDAFDLLLPTENRRTWNVRKFYSRKRKLENDQKKILPFQNEDTKEMIIQWLSNTQNVFDRITQSQEIYDFCEDDNNSFNLPSVSQSKLKSSNKRDYINLRTRKVKRPHSLDLNRIKTPIVKHLNKPSLSFTSTYNYNIEEFDTDSRICVEMENPNVQKNVIQKLEDDFLNSIETELDITKYNSNINNCEKSTNIGGSGWDRLKHMKHIRDTNYKRKTKKLSTLIQINTSTKNNDFTMPGDININLKDDSKLVENCNNPLKKSKKSKKKTDLKKNETIRSDEQNVQAKENLDLEIIDLTRNSPKKQKVAKISKQAKEQCEIIIKDLKKSEEHVIDAQENIQISKSIKTTKNKFALKKTASLNQETDVDDIFLITTPKATQRISNFDENQTKNINIIENFVFLPQNGFKNNSPEIMPFKSAEVINIPLEIDKLQKIIQKSTNFELKHKNIMTEKLDELLQMLQQNNFDVSSKIFETIGVQTDIIPLKNSCVQTENIEVQTDCLKNTSKSTQTLKLKTAEKLIQTTPNDYKKMDIGVQFEEIDYLNKSPEKYLMDEIVEKYLGPIMEVNISTAEDSDSSFQDVEINNTKNNKIANQDRTFIKNSTTSLNDKIIVPETQCNNDRQILTEDINDSNAVENPLNMAVMLSESEGTFFSKPAQKTQLESIDIVSQTQLQKNASSRLESVDIVTQTQNKKSPVKVFRAKLNSPVKNKSSEEAELSDGFEHLDYNTADILAGGEVSFQCKSLQSNIHISVEKLSSSTCVNRKLHFDKNNAKRIKRIRFPDDSDSDEAEPKPKKRLKNKFARDDLSIEFQTECVASNSDHDLPEELPEEVCDTDLADDFNFEDCLRNIEKNFDTNLKSANFCLEIIQSDLRLDADKVAYKTDQGAFNKKHEALLFKSPKRPKRSILSEIIAPNGTEKSPRKIQILDNVVVQSPNKSIDLDEIICSDGSFDENTKLLTLDRDLIWTLDTPKRDKGIKHVRNSPPLEVFKLPSLGETPDMFNLPPEGDEIFLPPPPQFANLIVSPQDPQIDSTNSPKEIPLDTSTQHQILSDKDPDYEILNLSPIKQVQEAPTSSKKADGPLIVSKRFKPKAKPLNITTHSTPKAKQNSILSYIKRTQNRTHLNTSSPSLLQDSEDIIQSPTILEKTLPCIACSRLNKEDVIAVTSLVRKKLITFKNNFEKSVTHLIVSVNKNNFVVDHTMKYISAISAGIWILNSDWIKDSIKGNELVSEGAYEVLDVSGSAGPKDSRLFRNIRPLLANFRIFAAPPFRTSEKSVVEDVVRNLGGTIVEDAIDFLDKGSFINLVITEASSTQSFIVDDDWINVYHVATVDIEWLSRSVGQYKLLSLLPFLLCDVDEIQDLHVYPQEYLVNIPGFTFSTQTENY